MFWQKLIIVALYGCEIFEDCKIVNDTYNTNSSWRNALDRMYIKMLAKKKPNKKDLDNIKGRDQVYHSYQANNVSLKA